ncbi:hypothetical protein [Arcticibacter tournemirensis]|uniref:Uncharacterized protein n=1 Tax=Arcticibacter tournemirensis TaxID=699437 RepID=A0A4Q0MDE0_9SPHI|nr:hypothetical protein [Arcticibacter tournemirensis]RXF71400.1 hypothetical protein EKH83_05480 [Arcticibacter tournemirensis]
MQEENVNRRSISTLEAQKILKKNGVDLSEKKTEEVLDLMYFFAKLIVDQYFKNEDSRLVHKGKHGRTG